MFVVLWSVAISLTIPEDPQKPLVSEQKKLQTLVANFNTQLGKELLSNHRDLLSDSGQLLNLLKKIQPFIDSPYSRFTQDGGIYRFMFFKSSRSPAMREKEIQGTKFPKHFHLWLFYAIKEDHSDERTVKLCVYNVVKGRVSIEVEDKIVQDVKLTDDGKLVTRLEGRPKEYSVFHADKEYYAEIVDFFDKVFRSKTHKATMSDYLAWSTAHCVRPISADIWRQVPKLLDIVENAMFGPANMDYLVNLLNQCGHVTPLVIKAALMRDKGEIWTLLRASLYQNKKGASGDLHSYLRGSSGPDKIVSIMATLAGDIRLNFLDEIVRLWRQTGDPFSVFDAFLANQTNAAAFKKAPFWSTMVCAVIRNMQVLYPRDIDWHALAALVPLFLRGITGSVDGRDRFKAELSVEIQRKVNALALGKSTQEQEARNKLFRRLQSWIHEDVIPDMRRTSPYVENVPVPDEWKGLSTMHDFISAILAHLFSVKHNCLERPRKCLFGTRDSGWHDWSGSQKNFRGCAEKSFFLYMMSRVRASQIEFGTRSQDGVERLLERNSKLKSLRSSHRRSHRHHRHHKPW